MGAVTVNQNKIKAEIAFSYINISFEVVKHRDFVIEMPKSLKNQYSKN